MATTTRTHEPAPAAASARAAAGPQAASCEPPAYGLSILDHGGGPIQRRAGDPGDQGPGLAAPNRTGLPDRLKSGVERLSGLAMDDVRVRFGSPAPARIGALAFTRGTEIHVAPGQERHLAHEAWHVVQQKQGRVAETTQRKGIGVNADTALEREADEMGARALALPAAGEQVAAPARGVASPTVQCYTEIAEDDQDADNWDADDDVRVSDDGHMAVAQQSEYGSKKLWASTDVIDGANQKLGDLRSVIRVGEDDSDTIKGPSPNHTGNRVLARVVARNVLNNTRGETLEIWADCGRSGRDVMGAGRGTGKNYGDMTGVYDKPHGFLGTLFNVSTIRNTRASSPKAMAAEIFQKLGGKGEYDKLSDDEKDEFDKKAGINRYAAPDVGEGFTMASGGQDFPNKSTWNFHWGGVIMVSGGDRVTLENYATGDEEEVNDEWDFQMYGPATKAGQTFHDQHKATQQHGMDPTTVHVKKR